MKKSYYIYLAFFLFIFIAGTGSAIFRNDALQNLYAHQAEAFLAGRLYITEKMHDVAIYDGKYYVPFPPFPAIVLTPFVALFGIENTKVVFIASMLTIVNGFTLNRIFCYLNINKDVRIWLIVGFFMGTGYWFALKSSGGVWFFAHIVAITCMLLAISEALGSGRGFLSGIFLGCAILSRQMSVYNYIFIAVAVFLNSRNTTRKSKIVHLTWLSIFVLLAILTYVGFNQVRFSGSSGTGYELLDVDGFLKARIDAFGLFHPIYLIHNFTYMFLQGPHFIFEGDILPNGMDPFGTSLTFASPFLFFVFKARWSKPLLIAAWTSIILCLFHILLYHANGWVQINAQRYSLDFMPVLIILMGLSLDRINIKTFKVFVLYAVALNFIAFGIIGSPMYQSLLDSLSVMD
jgi:hypothetical protein